MKNALTDVLLKFAKKYYEKNNIEHIEVLQQQFTDFCDVNDTFKEFMDNNFIFSETGRISRDRFMEIYSLQSGKQKEFKYTLGIIKKYGLTYDKNTTLKGHRGVIFGIEEKKKEAKEEIDICDELEPEDLMIHKILANKSLCEKLYKAIQEKQHNDVLNMKLKIKEDKPKVNKCNECENKFDVKEMGKCSMCGCYICKECACMDISIKKFKCCGCTTDADIHDEIDMVFEQFDIVDDSKSKYTSSDKMTTQELMKLCM